MCRKLLQADTPISSHKPSPPVASNLLRPTTRRHWPLTFPGPRNVARTLARPRGAEIDHILLVSRPIEGRRKGLVHIVCACSVTLRILGLWILLYTPFINPRSCPRPSVLLDFEPHSDSVIWQQVNQFCKLASPMCSSSDREGYQN